MGPLGIPELIFIFVLALLIFGPRKLPEIGRTIGRGLAEFRKASTDLKRTINAEMIEEEVRLSDPRKILAESLNPIPGSTSKNNEKRPLDVTSNTPDDASSESASSDTSSESASEDGSTSPMRQAPGTVSRGSVLAAADTVTAVEPADSDAEAAGQAPEPVAVAEQPVESKAP